MHVRHLGFHGLAVTGPHPTIIPLVVVLSLAGALTLALVVVMTRDRGPRPAEVAAGYEQAWDDLDFERLWILSAPELRDGRSRDDFVHDKRAAYQAGGHLRHLAVASTPVRVDVDPTDPQRATVTMAVDLRDGDRVTSEVRLARRDGVWRVTEYRLTSPPSGADTNEELPHRSL